VTDYLGTIMSRLIVATTFAASIFSGTLLAEDYTGKIKSLDVKKRELTVTADGKDLTFPIDKDASVFYEAKPKKKGQPGGLEPVPGGLGALKAGNDVTITTEKKGDAETVSLIKLESPLAQTNPKK
jgi:hypothetical protein